MYKKCGEFKNSPFLQRLKSEHFSIIIVLLFKYDITSLTSQI